MSQFKQKFHRASIAIAALVFALALTVGVENAQAAKAPKCPTLSAGQTVRIANGGKLALLVEGARLTFISDEAFLTWYPNQAKVKKVVPACLDAFPDSGLIGFRPGSRLVTLGKAKDVYAVLPQNVLHKIANPSVGRALYGANWKALARKLTGRKAELYEVQDEHAETIPHDGQLLKKKGDKGVYYVMDGELKMLNGKLAPFLTRDLRTVSADVFGQLTVGVDTITSAEIVADPTQGAEPLAVEVKPADTSSPTNNNKPDSSATTKFGKSTSVDGMKFTGANYTGPFPAAEGIVLEGTAGEDKFQEPTGSGPFKFRTQTAWARPVICLDDTRLHVGSKGATWEAGWNQGYTIGKSDWTALPQLAYNETPHGTQAGNALYDEGYRAGYVWGYTDNSISGSQRNCPRTDNDLDRTDADGWYEFRPEKMPSVKKIYGTPDSTLSNSTQSALGNDSKSFTLHTSEIEGGLNSSKGALNLSLVDVLDGEMDAAEAAMTNEQFAKALYDVNKNNIEKVIKNGCKLTSPEIETKSYANNSFTYLSYMVACPTGLDSGDRWNQVRYAFARNGSGNRLLTLYFNNPNNVRKTGAQTVDDAKLMNVGFVEQLLNKIKYE